MSTPVANNSNAPKLWSVVAAGCFFALVLSQFNFPDPDMFHELALAREAVALRHVPTQDLFAYTPTVSPVVHHEWGTGMVLYFATRAAGVSALLLIRYLLAFSTAALAVYIAIKWGGTWVTIAFVGFLAGLPLSNGFATVRAQDFTLFFTCLLLLCIQLDARGRRWWVFIWPFLYVIWLNLHGGFVAGVALFAVHIVETCIRTRGRKIVPLLIAMGLMAILVLVNPYGTAYPRYIIHAVTMPRPKITEWAPILQADPSTLSAFSAISLLFLYCLWRNGWAGTEGCLLLAAALVMAGLHLRHASLAGLVALCYLPAWLRATSLGSAVDHVCSRRPGLTAVVCASVAGICVFYTLRNAPWRLPIPANGEDWAKQEPVVYPAGATDYLRQNHITANVMTPFTVGGFVSWKCYPLIKVSIDGRYEVAFNPSLLPEVMDLYAGKPGWEATLERYPTDLVLVPQPARLRSLLGSQHKWSCVYRDDAYELWARPGLFLPDSDNRSHRITAVIP